MSPEEISFGRMLRDRREALGLTQEQVAEAAGVSSSTVSRWERGESQPVPAQIEDLRDVLKLSEAEAVVWGARLTPPPPPPLQESEVSVEFTYEVPEEWLPPGLRIGPPVLDRAALQGRRPRAEAARHLAPVRSDDAGPADPFGVAPPQHDERVRRVVREGIERRATRRRERADRRKEREERLEVARSAAERGGDGAFALPRVAGGSPYAPEGFSTSSHLEEYLSIANTGSAFPIPSGTKGQRKYTYSDAGPTLRQDAPRYWLRTVALLVVLGVLAGVLAWALFELGEGWSAVIDLFRDGPAPTTSPVAELTDAMGWLGG